MIVNSVKAEQGIAELLQPDKSAFNFGIVHRLDRDTSGLLIIAKTKETQVKLQELFKSRKVSKKYLALVSPKPKLMQARLELPLTRNPKNREKWQVGINGKLAISQYKTLKQLSRYSLLEIEILTGRTHQIRAHLAHLHSPVVGDTLYGAKTRPDGLTRQFLHASKLSFQLDEQSYNFTSDLPPDLASFLRL